jgi:opacity protein-like surface antigen
MMRRTRLLLLCAAASACSPAFADDFLGIYVGAGVGRSTLNQDYYQIDSSVTGWKLLAGWRPLSSLGVEAEYADLGSKGVTTFGGTAHVDTDAKATAVYAVGYLPVPLPWIDVYAKLGAARVKADTSIYPIGSEGTVVASTTDNDRTSLAWGAGLQFKWSRLAARVDYERFDGPQGNPSLLAAEFIFNF